MSVKSGGSARDRIHGKKCRQTKDVYREFHISSLVRNCSCLRISVGGNHELFPFDELMVRHEIPINLLIVVSDLGYFFA